jgi:hypothetical protein
MRLDGMKRHLRILQAALLILLLSSRIGAMEGPGCTGASYLQHPVGCKSIAMGEVQAALYGDPLNWHSNPGALAYMGGYGITAFHAEWIFDTRYDHISAHYRVNDMFVVSGGVIFTYRPTIQGYDETGIETGELKSNNYQTVLGLGLSPIRNFTAGINVKYFREKLDEWNADGMGVDLGLLYHFERTGTSAGLTAQNLGPDIRFDGQEEPLPLTLRFGLSQSIDVKPDILGVTGALDLVKPRYEDIYIGVGFEMELYRTLAARIGYCGRKSREGSGLTVGGGFFVNNSLLINYAWTPYGDLGNFHYVSISYMFPK